MPEVCRDAKFEKGEYLVPKIIIHHWCSYWLILLFFFKNFQTKLTTIHVWSVASLPNFHKLCIWLISKFWYVNMPNVIVGYRRSSNLIEFFGNFHIWNVMSIWNLHKLYWKSYSISSYLIHNIICYEMLTFVIINGYVSFVQHLRRTMAMK